MAASFRGSHPETRRVARGHCRIADMLAASASENVRMASTVRAMSRENARTRPSGASDTSRGSGAMNSTPRAARRMSRTTDGPKRPDRVREGRAMKPRRDLFGDGATADHRPTLQDERLQPGSRQVEGRGQSVDASADDDDHCQKTGVRRQETEVGVMTQHSACPGTLPASWRFPLPIPASASVFT